MALRSIAILGFLAAQLFTPVAISQIAVTVSIDEHGQLAVEEAPSKRIHELTSRAGLVVWPENDRDRWSSLANFSARRAPSQPTSNDLLSAGSRGDVAGHDQAIDLIAQQLDQLLGAELLKAANPGDIITPPDGGAVANPLITIRRLPADREPDYPADELVLYQGRSEIAHIAIAAGADSVRWSEVAGMPPKLKNGLPPGRYLLESSANRVRVRFTVLSPQVWQQFSARAAALAKLTDQDDDPLVAHLLVEDLLGESDEQGRPAPLVADAVDVLATAKRTQYLETLHKQLIDQLSGNPAPMEPAADATGVEPIDAARDHIAHGQWRRARDALDKIGPEAPQRHRALAILYNAVVLSESGAATGADAESLFQAALKELSSGAPGDAYRAHYNSANFLLRRAQDRLYNHAFQSATGGQEPVLRGLRDWLLAREQLQLAEAVASKIGPAAIAAVKVNVARLYMLLVDVLSVLNSGLPPQQRFLEGEQAAIKRALDAASELVDLSRESGEDLVTAVAHEIIAHLAYRQGDYERCRSEADVARKVYLDHGFFVGVEGIERLLGLTYLRESAAAADQAAQMRDLALRHFLVSQELAEALRERFPEDAVGLSRAGFLARRAYVNEKIVELHLLNDQPELALRAVEAVKSRSLSDVLSLQQRSAAAPPPAADQVELSGIDWPEGAVALEYFIGSERAWVFLIRGREVQAFPLTDAQGKPIESRRLVADVQQFLFDIDHSAQKMARLLHSGRALDAAWQDKLHDFYNLLIPAAARPQIERAKLVLFVPHHILHYFPFAALVVERDSKPRKPSEMPMPKFFVEQGQTIIYAPSLSTWAILRGKSPIAKSVNAVAISQFAGAPSLPGASQDLKNLRDAFGEMLADVVEDSEATEENLHAVLKRPGFTYIGTHGKNIADRPLESFLLCQPGAGDGRLKAAELYENKPLADIVVLGACYSGLGDRSPLPGDDLFGLQRAFLHTGVKTVVAGLWDVYDDTGVEIMRNFFAELRTGQTVPQSLADSQRKFLAARRAEGPTDFWIHPYFWAVYKATGSDLARVAPSAETN